MPALHAFYFRAGINTNRNYEKYSIKTVIFPPPLNVMRYVNLIKLQNSQLNKTAVISRFYYSQTKLKNMAIEYNSEEMFDKYRLTNEQIKSCKKVFKAIKDAGKLGVEFWDMYGTLKAYNGKVFERLHMDDVSNGIQIINCEGEELLYSERLDNFNPGCSDDDVWAELRNGL